MKILSSCLIIGLLVMASAVHAARPFDNFEQAYEFLELDINLRGEQSGTITVKPDCKDCREVTLTITSDTIFIREGREYPIAQAVRFRGKPGVVFYKTDTTDVTRLKIY